MSRVRSSNHRVYEVLSGPWTGNNGKFFVVRDEDDDNIELKSAGIIAGMEPVEE
jgi:hypothetical protein